VDGDVHDLQKEEDERREKVLSELGLRVVRFRNDEVMRDLSPSLRFGDAPRSAVVGRIKELLENARNIIP
jgi:very-short-patch-repair endonuclease